MDHPLQSTTLRALHLNNRGAVLLLMQNYHEAREVFVEAMALCKEGMDRLAHDERHKADEGSRECCFLSTEDDTLPSLSCTCANPSCCMMLHESSSPPSEQHVGGGYLHPNPIHVPLQQNNCTHPLPSLNFLAGTIIFNQALTLHLGAMHALHNDTTVLAGRDELQRAMQMYQVGYAILAEDCYPNPRIVLATINNLGHGYYTLGQVDIAEKCWEELLSLLMVYVSQGGFDNFGLEGCVRNMLPQATISGAPAA
jgi:tetratricopeptide (TPR) repeat protein